MKPEPARHQAPALDRAVLDILQAGPYRRVVVLGRPRLASRLAEAGFEVWRSSAITEPPPRTADAVVSVGQLARLRAEETAAALARVATWLEPEGLFAAAEIAAEGTLGRKILAGLRRLRRRPALDPAHICESFLRAGFRPVRQTWPQGVASWLLTYGTLAPLAELRSERDTP